MYIVEITYPRQNWPLLDANLPEPRNYGGYFYIGGVGEEQRMISFYFEELPKAENFEEHCKQNIQVKTLIKRL